MALSLAPAAVGLAAAALVVSVWPAASTSLVPAPDPPKAMPGRDGTWPVTPTTVLRGFDAPTTYAPGHRGVDLSAGPGQPVASSLAGTVTVAGPVAGRPVVVVTHDGGLRTTYLPVTPIVAVGDLVRAGEQIGRVAPQGHCVSTACLHWGARLADDYIDPLGLLGGESGQVVLLPPLERAAD